jgi:GST-like protein
MGEWRLYGVRGWGSTLAEGALSWTGTNYQFEEVEGFDQPGPARERLIAVNPLGRVPTLVTPSGDVLTESAAIVLFLADLYPEAHLAPKPGETQRAAFLNRLLWFVSVVYPTFTYRDYPERWVKTAPEQLVQSVDEFRRSLWSQFENEVGSGPFALGERPSALDLYISVMSHWRPRRDWLAHHCPKLHAIAVKAEGLPALRSVMARNFH